MSAPRTIWQGGLPRFVRQAQAAARRAAGKLPPLPRKPRRWTQWERELLRERYPAEGASRALCEALGRSASSVRGAAQACGLCLPREVYVALARSRAAGKHATHYSRRSALAQRGAEAAA